MTRALEEVITVLLVEDNQDNCVIIQTWLEHAGFQVIIARDGPSGMTTARTVMPDVILMDVSLPGSMDGWTAARELKSDDATGRIPIIAFTAHTLPHDEQRAREAGVDGYLTKPAALTRVLEEVKRVLPR